jgi:hypothetical protein
MPGLPEKNDGQKGEGGREKGRRNVLGTLYFVSVAENGLRAKSF